MQNSDTHDSELTLRWPATETATEDSGGQHERWPLDHSKNGYGRPDPEELALIPSEAQLSPDSAGRENTEPENQSLSPTTEPTGQIWGSDLRTLHQDEGHGSRPQLEAWTQPEVEKVGERQVAMDNLGRTSADSLERTSNTSASEARTLPTPLGYRIAETGGDDHEQHASGNQGGWPPQDQLAGDAEQAPTEGTELVREHGSEFRPDLGWNEHHTFKPNSSAADDLRLEAKFFDPVPPVADAGLASDHPPLNDGSVGSEVDRGRSDRDDPTEGVESGVPVSDPSTVYATNGFERGELNDRLLAPDSGSPSGADRATATASLARSAKTEKEYDKRVHMIWRRSVKRRTTDPEQPAIVSPLEVTQDFIADRSRLKWSDATWNLYRAAMLWHLAARRHTFDVYEQSYQLLSNAKASSSAPREKKPKQKKTISEKHLNQLIDTLGAMNRHVKWGARAQFWLQAGLASGLRPGEWLGASWLDEKKKILCVPNSKRKTTVSIYSVVSPGQTIHDVEADNPERLAPGSLSDESKRIRNIPIKPKDSFWVSVHLANLNDYLDKVPEEEREERFATYYHTCRKYVYEACVRTFGGTRHYSLYTMRSQYAANMKAEMPLADVSQLMGHEPSGKTTKKDYGPRSAAHGGRGKLTPLEKQARAEAQAGPKCRRRRAIANSPHSRRCGRIVQVSTGYASTPLPQPWRER